MNSTKKIKKALISVYYKDGLEQIIQLLVQNNVELLSTGGTGKFIQDLGYSYTKIEDLTSYPEILGGRVKTLHPAVFGGILNRRESNKDQEEITRFNIPEIDLVIVDLYPFEETVKSGAEHQDIIEKIDIGGISLIRAAAKNYKDVVILAGKNTYGELLEQLKNQECSTTLAQRKVFATKAFHISSHYDTQIFNYFNSDANEIVFKHSIAASQTLRYGENPHQKGYFYGDLEGMFTKLNGKELSYNNLVDVDAAVNLIDEFRDQPTFAILKHTNACGIASAAQVSEAWKLALSCDPVSAFGGVLIANETIDKITAENINQLFFEVLIAPNFEQEALAVLTQKKNRILLKRNSAALPQKHFKTLLNGVIEQDKDAQVELRDSMQTVTTKSPSEGEFSDLEFALKVVKHTKSNTIVLVKNQQLMASGVGQTSRVDALKQALIKATEFGFDTKGSSMASDAFFPFPDCVEIAAEAGITAIVQPGGSIKDEDSIKKANEKNIAMVTTGIRHFKH